MLSRYLALVIGCLIVCQSGLQAADIETIKIEGEGPGTIDEAFIQAHILSRAGAQFQAGMVARDVKALLDTGRYTSVRADLEQLTPDKVNLIYVIRRRMVLVEPPRVSGNDKLRDSRVQDILGLEPGDLVDDAVMAGRIKSLEEEYEKKRYPNARISWEFEVVNNSLGTAICRLTIDEGKALSLGSAHFEGNTVFDDKELKKVVIRRRIYNPFSWGRQPYDTDILEFSLDNIRRMYMNEGYLDVQIEDEGDHQPDAKGRIHADLHVVEGQQYHVGNILLKGVTLFPEADVRDVLALDKGDVASYDQIIASLQNVQSFYGDRGYINAAARPNIITDKSSGVIDLEIQVSEGQLVSLRNVLVRGNRRTKDKVLRRELTVYPGETYNLSKVQRSETRLRNLGFFSKVLSYDEETLDPSTRDLVFEVEEGRTGQFMIGAGFSSIDKVVGFIELSQSNFDLAGWPFIGAGQKLKLSLSAGSNRDEFVLSFTEPWFLDRRLSLGADLFRRERRYSDYDEARTGAGLRLSHPLGRNSRITFSYKIQDVEVTDVADTNVYSTASGEDFFFDTSQDALKSTFGVGLLYDTRNRVFVPTKGAKVDLDLEVTGGPFGADSDFYDAKLEAAQFVPLWFKHVLLLRGRLQVVEPFGDQDDLAIVDRLYAGGARTIRGFEWRDVGPKAFREIDDVNGNPTTIHRPIGGASMAVLTAEYTIPITEGIRFATFADAGNVWDDSWDFDFNEYAASAGFGIRIDVPGFPIRLDYGFDLKKDDEFTETDPWSFSIRYDN